VATWTVAHERRVTGTCAKRCNISGPGEEPSGGEGVLASDGCPFCGLKGHKTKNSVRCLYSTKPTSKYYSSDNRAGGVFISGEGDFCAEIVCGLAMGRQY
jgi:hypothetical protein